MTEPHLEFLFFVLLFWPSLKIYVSCGKRHQSLFKSQGLNNNEFYIFLERKLFLCEFLKEVCELSIPTL